MNKTILLWEIIGLVLIIGVGGTLHYWFVWSNYWRPMAILSPVNESTWEHFKLVFWPSLFFAVVEFFFIGSIAHNFLAAKFLSILAMPIITMILFYGYKAILGYHFLAANITVFILSVLGGQLLGLYILNNPMILPSFARPAAMAGLIIMTAAFSLLSFFPLDNFLFRQPETGEIGILELYKQHEEDEDHDE